MMRRFSDDTYSAGPHRSLIQAGRSLVFLWFGLIAVVLLACTTLPKPEMKTLTLAYVPHSQRQLAVVTQDLLKGKGPETSGFFMLLRNDEALRWRLLQADLAEETLDIQVFIWKGDASSDLLAAQRDLAARQLASSEKLVAFWQQKVGNLRQKEAEAAKKAAIRGQEETRYAHPAIQAIAEENAKLAEIQASLVVKVQALTKYSEQIDTKLAAVGKSFAETRARVDTAGRVEKFERKVAAAGTPKAKKRKKQEEKVDERPKTLKEMLGGG